MDTLFWKGVSYETLAGFRLCVFGGLCHSQRLGSVWLVCGADMLRLQPVPAAATNNTFVAPSAYQADPASSSPVAGNASFSATADYSQQTQTASPAMPAVPPVPANATPMGLSVTGQQSPGPVPPALADPGYQPSYMPSFQAANTACNSGAACGVYSGPVNQYQQAACGLGCGNCNGCEWYGSVLALMMTRDHGNKLWTSYQSGVEANQIMNTQDAAVGWEWGTEITFGRSFCCNQYSIEATYWTLHEFDGYACASIPGGNVDTPLNTSLMYFHGETAQDGSTAPRNIGCGGSTKSTTSS